MLEWPPHKLYNEDGIGTNLKIIKERPFIVFIIWGWILNKELTWSSSPTTVTRLCEASKHKSLYCIVLVSWNSSTSMYVQVIKHWFKTEKEYLNKIALSKLPHSTTSKDNPKLAQFKRYLQFHFSVVTLHSLWNHGSPRHHKLLM